LISPASEIETIETCCFVWVKLGLTIGEEHRLRVFENRVLRICGPKSEEVAGGCRTLHNDELQNLYASPNIIRVIKLKRVRLSGHKA